MWLTTDVLVFALIGETVAKTTGGTSDDSYFTFELFHTLLTPIQLILVSVRGAVNNRIVSLTAGVFLC